MPKCEHRAASGKQEACIKTVAEAVSVAVVGERPELAAICREALPESPEVEWTLLEATSGTDVPEADLIVWDLQAGGPIPELDNLPPSIQNIFVVHESCLGTLCRRLPIAAAASILVEPVQPDELRDFLGRVFRRHLEGSRGADPRRADRNELFQALLLAGLRLDEFRGERGHFFKRALRDLRGPMTALGGYCGLLLDQQLGPLTGAQLDVLRQMQECADRLSSLLASTLHLSQGVLDASEVQVKPGDITLVLDRAVAQVMPGTEAREIAIRLDAVQPAEVLHFDFRLIHEVLVCLLNNACRFTSFQGVVEVRGYPVRSPEQGSRLMGSGVTEPSGGLGSGDVYRIDIRDFGVPIPPGCLPSVFKMSADCGGGFDRSQGGLELAMCKMIMEAHKGEIRVESSESGTVFSVILPQIERGRPYFETT